MTLDGKDDARARLEALRTDLAQALRQENFLQAANLHDEIQTIEASATDEVAVTLANDAFYNALRSGDADAMALIWLQTDSTSCAHALGGIVVGFDQVIDSWRRVFVAGRPSHVEVDILSLEVRRNLAWVICKQVVTSTRGRETLAGERVATNLFQKQKGQWRVAHHHASPVVVEDVINPRNDEGGPDAKGTS